MPTRQEREIKEKEVLAQLKQSARAGDPKSMFLLGSKSSDPIEGMKWLQRSAELEYGLAMDAVAYDRYYLRSIDKQIPPEERKQAAMNFQAEKGRAFPKILDGANRGDLDSMYGLGVGGFVQLGFLSQDEAMNWLRRAAEGGHQDASYRLGEKLLNKKSAKESSEGFELLRRMADGGNFNATLEMARKYTHGWPRIGLAPNPDEAMKWINKAIAISGEPEGEFMPTHGLLDPYEAARLRGENPRIRKEKPKAPQASAKQQ
jgi:TPR repeat protein